MRPDLFSERDSRTVIASDRFNMDHKRRVQDCGINEVEQNIKKFCQTPVTIEDAKNNGHETLAHRLQGYTWSGIDIGDRWLV